MIEVRWGRNSIRNSQWTAGCYRDLLRTKHFRLRRYFTREFYVKVNRRSGVRLGSGMLEVSVLCGTVNGFVWREKHDGKKGSQYRRPNQEPRKTQADRCSVQTVRGGM